MPAVLTPLQLNRALLVRQLLLRRRRPPVADHLAFRRMLQPVRFVQAEGEALLRFMAPDQSRHRIDLFGR